MFIQSVIIILLLSSYYYLITKCIIKFIIFITILSILYNSRKMCSCLAEHVNIKEYTHVE